MGIRDLLFETWSALAANKGRSALTILGIVIGIAAVIAMTSLIGGVKQSLVSELGLEQSRAVFISYWSGESTTLASLDEIKQSVDGYDFVTGSQFSTAKASTEKKESECWVEGVAPHFFQTTSSTVLHGRLLTDTEAASYDLVVVIDSSLARTLYGEDIDPIGKELTIGDAAFSVVGVIESSSMFATQGSAYIPYGTCRQRISGYEEIDQIVGFCSEDADVAQVANDTEQYLRSRYNITDDDNGAGGYVYVETMQSIQQELDATMMSFQVLMTAVASISLLVGGIGIMNMMLTNVTERIREIGLRKSLGARRRDITLQFLVESVTLCLAGGVIGFLLGLGAAYALSGAASMLAEGMQVRPYFDITTILMVVAICTVIGIVFGYGPARRAAKLDPVESLRFQ